MKSHFLSLLLVLTLFSCKNSVETPTPSEELGVLKHQFKIDAAASEDFEKGLLLLHSFEYDDAKTAFISGKEKASSEIMNYWGEAMCHYKALWGLQNKREGYEVMEQLGITKEERMAKIDDPLEKDFWTGLEILYGDGSLEERNKAFNEHMGMLYEKYPGNNEAAAFYALSMMWDNGEDGDLIALGKKSAAISQKILEENPLHPGALHYTIHAYDNPEIADLAMNAADHYSQVAPDAAHALHMPSHIYLARGMWNEVAKSNEVSYQASVNRMERLGLGDEARGYHSHAWLHYAYLQQGRAEDALKLLKDMEVYFKGTQEKSIRSYFVSMQAAHYFETGEWPEDLNYIDIDVNDLGLYARMNKLALQAAMANEKGDAGKLMEVREELAKEINIAELYVSNENTKMCSTGPTRYAPNKESIKKAKVVLNELLAMEALNAGDYQEVESFLNKAVEIESDSEYSFGPADIALPSFEYLGDYLMDKKDFEKALAMYDKSLERAPNRRKALMGKYNALKAMNKADEAKSVKEILKEFSSDLTLASL